MPQDKRSASNPTESFSMEDFEKALGQFDQDFQRGQVVTGKVFSHESTGAYIDIGAKSLAFVPTAEASLRGVSDLTSILPVGDEEREFLIIREENADGQLTLSVKQLEMKKVWDSIAELGNASMQVRVTGMNKGGVTVDVKGLRGFIPRSHLNERNDLEALKGKTLDAVILECNPETKKLVMSNRLATRSASFSQLEVGQLIEGPVTGLRPFGVFIALDDGLTGLLHVKQVSEKYIQSLDSLFKVGQTVKAVIVNLDEGKGQVALSTRLLENFPGEVVEAMDTVMDEAGDRLTRAQKKLLNPA
jgi:small subunit ribosomal protein S1